MNRQERAQIGQEAVVIASEGCYRTAGGATVDIADNVRRCVEGTRLIRPSDWPAIVRRGREAPDLGEAARADVTPETTLAAARRLVEREGAGRLFVLNFASAKNPGGGFLGGSRAQEESLARSSALYASLQAAKEYYDQNRRARSTLYTDHAIASPDVPVFRDDDGTLLDRPYQVTFFTMPAVNFGALRPGAGDHAKVEPVMAGRVEKVLAFAAAEGFEQLLLGAWGCGAFRNDPRLIARLFFQALFGDGGWGRKFRRVVFAVFDPTLAGENRRPFDEAFATVARGARKGPAVWQRE
jgi:uncharacterized protein (TIGR02452 family)